jgi:hypothetical protein
MLILAAFAYGKLMRAIESVGFSWWYLLGVGEEMCSYQWL